MTESEVLSQIVEHLDLIFPDGGNGPFWSQEPYRSDLFKLFAASYETCPIHGDRIWLSLKDRWFPRRNLSEQDSRIVFEICQAWTEWKYAWDKFPR
ncbi:MAG: hypothetical protein BGO49_02195 [Planctomycetales bacterium 71-10]|nr:MAG: hypothetical protein BGO49_02195 [Planctomycetales bacterium 71-10]